MLTEEDDLSLCLIVYLRDQFRLFLGQEAGAEEPSLFRRREVVLEQVSEGMRGPGVTVLNNGPTGDLFLSRRLVQLHLQAEHRQCHEMSACREGGGAKNKWRGTSSRWHVGQSSASVIDRVVFQTPHQRTLMFEKQNLPLICWRNMQ